MAAARRRRTILALLVAALAGAVPATVILGASNDIISTIRITSPLGRSGLPGTVRIVAQVSWTGDGPPPPVRFYVDDTLLGTDVDGPPYAVEWEDENPFEPRRLTVELGPPAGEGVRDEVTLQPFEFVDVAQVLSVGVDAAVTDARGRAVPGLTAADFALLEDGAAQPLDVVSSESLPATFALLIDASQSMGRNIEAVRAAAGAFPAHVRDADTVVIAPFRQGIIKVTGPTRDHTTLAEAVTDIRSGGTTAILDALAESSDRFAAGTGRRVVVLVTDGYDERSQTPEELVLERLRASRVTVYVISIGGVSGVSIAGERLLRRIASETGGRAFFPWNAKQLAEAHAAIADDVRQQYHLTYTPTNQRQDGAWRTITLKTTTPTHQVRARSGYRAPMPPPIRASLEFTVTDSRRQLIELAADDFEVFEDGIAQTLDVFQEAVAPISIALALDASGSMTKATPALQDAAHRFVDALRPTDPLELSLFSDKPTVVHELSTTRSRSHAGITAYRANGGTALYDGLVDAIERLRSTEGRRVVVVMTDGYDENRRGTGPGSTRKWDAVVQAARDVDVTVYAIGLGSKVDRKRLDALADLTGGEAYFASDVTQLDQQYRRVLDELRRRYVVAYTSTNTQRDGRWRRVEIRPKRSVHVRSRGGYFAPAQ